MVKVGVRFVMEVKQDMNVLPFVLHMTVYVQKVFNISVYVYANFYILLIDNSNHNQLVILE
jgi:hypothetical protein